MLDHQVGCLLLQMNLWVLWTGAEPQRMQDIDMALPCPVGNGPLGPLMLWKPSWRGMSCLSLSIQDE